MTALRPTENARVVGVKDGQMKLLRKLLLNKTCGHPECTEATADAHHCFPRSLIAGDSWWVEITEDDGSSKVIPHVIGLCRLHHDRVEMHDAWIKLEEGAFNWYDRERKEHGDASGPPYEEWNLIGPLAPQPGEVGESKKRKPGKKKGEVRPYRAQWNVGVPQDERENGADVLDELESAFREKYHKELGWSETAPRYMVVVAALVKSLQ